MTAAQKDALERLLDILREHFEGGVVVVQTENESANDEIQVSWHGGYANACGLLDLGKARIVEERQRGND